METSTVDVAGLNQFDTMSAMADLETLTLTDVLFSEAIIADGYAEVWDLISALDDQKLDALTIVPEPSTLALLTVAGLALFLWRRRATSR